MKHLLFTMVFLGLVGCGVDGGDSSSPPAAQERGGLTVLSATVEQGLSGYFSENGITIRFAAKRVSPIPQEVRDVDQEAPSHEIDAWFQSENGEPFLTQIGGHNFHDPAWLDHQAQEFPTVDLERRQEEFVLAEKAALAVSELNMEALAEEQDALARLGAVRADSIRPSEISEEAPGVEPGYDQDNYDFDSVPPGYGTVSQALVNDSAHVFRVYKKPLDYGGGIVGDHSSTWSVSYANQGLSDIKIAQRITCNHGACANDASMAWKCGKSWFNRPGNLPPMGECARNRNDNHPNMAGCCWTNYGIAPNNGRHVCNDDSRYQREVMRMVGVAGPLNAGFCADNDLAWRAPNCQ
jgi:hypothetical protein